MVAALIMARRYKATGFQGQAKTAAWGPAAPAKLEIATEFEEIERVPEVRLTLPESIRRPSPVRPSP
jgi:hypothetical protein